MVALYFTTGKVRSAKFRLKVEKVRIVVKSRLEGIIVDAMQFPTWL